MIVAGDGSSVLIRVLICRSFSISLGEKPLEVGVRRYCIRNSCKAVLGGIADCLSACVNVWMRRSAAPLVAGWYSALDKWMMFLSLHQCRNSSLRKPERLSLNNVWAKSCSSSSIVALAEIDCVGWIQEYFEYASVSPNQFDPMKLMAWSRWIRLHGFSGNTNRCIAVFAGLFWCLPHEIQLRHFSSMSPSMRGQ